MCFLLKPENKLRETCVGATFILSIQRYLISVSTPDGAVTCVSSTQKGSWRGICNKQIHLTILRKKL